MVINWMKPEALRLPEFGKYRGLPQHEALLAITGFTNRLAVDLSGTLEYQIDVNRIYDYRTAIKAVPVSECLDERAQAICAEHDTVAVLCAGDIDSVAALVAICKHTADISKVIVRYTKASLVRYPKLFNEILPDLGVTLERRDGKDLVGNSDVYYVDGRSGDDWQAAYESTAIGMLRRMTDISDLEDVKEYIASSHDQRPKMIRAAMEGLDMFIENCPIEITDGWSLIVAIYRFCVTQSSSVLGHINEDDPEHSFKYRLPFYDDPMFTNATAYIIQNPSDPTEDNAQLREYIYDYFGDEEYKNTQHSAAVYYAHRVGKLNTHFLGENCKPITYDDLIKAGK